MTVRPETKFLDPLICTTRDGVRNVFRDVQVITSVDKDQVIQLVREFGVRMKEILVYERVTEAIQARKSPSYLYIQVDFELFGNCPLPLLALLFQQYHRRNLQHQVSGDNPFCGKYPFGIPG